MVGASIRSISRSPVVAGFESRHRPSQKLLTGELLDREIENTFASSLKEHPPALHPMRLKPKAPSPRLLYINLVKYRTKEPNEAATSCHHNKSRK